MALNLLAACYCFMAENRKERRLFLLLPAAVGAVVCALVWRLCFSGGLNFSPVPDAPGLLLPGLLLSLPGSILNGLALSLLYREIRALPGRWRKAGTVLLLLLIALLGLGIYALPGTLLFGIAGIPLGQRRFPGAERAAERICGWNRRLRDAAGAFFANTSPEDEEDFMNTGKGKIVMVICVLMVIYMIGSAFAIYKLNAKINSVYQITQEMK